jgi:hypothetical protein
VLFEDFLYRHSEVEDVLLIVCGGGALRPED